MPKVEFVHEHVTVEVEAGRRLSDVAKEQGIATCRETLAGTGIGNHTVWVQGDAGGRTPWERLWRLTGWRRFATRVRVLGDLRVWTQQGLAGQDRVTGPIAPPGAGG